MMFFINVLFTVTHHHLCVCVSLVYMHLCMHMCSPLCVSVKSTLGLFLSCSTPSF